MRAAALAALPEALWEEDPKRLQPRGAAASETEAEAASETEAAAATAATMATAPPMAMPMPGRSDAPLLSMLMNVWGRTGQRRRSAAACALLLSLRSRSATQARGYDTSLLWMQLARTSLCNA